MTYRIVSDGTPRGTRVLDPAGNELDMHHVVAMSWNLEANGLATATFTVSNCTVDAECAATWTGELSADDGEDEGQAEGAGPGGTLDT